jgi:hypothetical protein
MDPEFDAPRFDQVQADEYLDALSKLTSIKLGNLSGSTSKRLPEGLAIVESLRRSSVTFGDPRNELDQLTEETFKESGTELTSLYKRQMQTQFDFYYMTLTVDMLSRPGVQFRRLTCKLDFSLEGADQPIVQTIFPNQQWREVLSVGVGMKVGLDGNLDWSAGVDSEQLTQVISALPGNFKANASNTNKFSGVVVIPDYRYSLGQTEITALGQGNSNCYWRLQNQELQRINTTNFGIVFKVPKGTNTITLNGLVWAEPDMNWLTADIKDVFSELMHRFKNISRNKEEAASQFARGDAKEWQLNLPKDITPID